MFKRRYNEGVINEIIVEIDNLKNFDNNQIRILMNLLIKVKKAKKITQQDYDDITEIYDVIYLTQLQDETNNIIKKMKDIYKIKKSDLLHYKKNLEYSDFENKENAIKLINYAIKMRTYLTTDIIIDINDLIKAINADASLRIINKKITYIEQEIKDVENNKDNIDEQEKEEYNILFMNSRVKNKEWLNKQDINILFKKPLNDEDNEGSYKSPIPNSTHQIDTLMLPEDSKTKFKYLLVVTDVYNRMTDAEPMLNKNSETTKDSLIKIYKRKFLKTPLQIICDNGTEFKGVFKKYFKSLNVYVKSLPTGKHLGIVDRRMQIIGNAIMRTQAKIEMETKKTNTDWVSNIKKIIELLNQYSKQQVISQSEPFNEDGLIDEIKFNKKNEIVQIGTEVFKILYYPVDNANNKKKLHGKFRTGDKRFESKMSIITGIIARPDSTIYYVVDNDDQNPINRNEFIINTKNKPIKKISK
jgi:hypothetical protein